MSTTSTKTEHASLQPRRRAQRGRPSTKHPQVSDTPKQWQCNWEACSKSFGRKSDLIRHHHTHTGTRNHKCPFAGCGKTFIQTSALTVHIRTHTGEKPHECHMCSKRFSDSSSLARHRKIHSNDRPYPCRFDGCDKSFCRKSTLNKHMTREHPGANQSPITEDSDDDTNQSPRLQIETSFSSRDQMSQSSGMDLQSPYVKSEVGAFIANPAQYSRLSPVTRLPSNDYYSHTQPSTPNVPNWQGTNQTHPQSHQLGSKGGRFPMQLKTSNSLQYSDLGPMSAPICQSEFHYRNQHSMPQSASFLTADFTSNYSHEVTDTYNAAYSLTNANEGHIHPPMLPPHIGTQDVSRRPLQAQIKVEQLAPNDPEQATISHAPEMYAYTTQEYREPVNLGITTDLSNHYQLPSTGFGGWGLVDDDKYQDTFGEPTPGQLASQYSF